MTFLLQRLSSVTLQDGGGGSHFESLPLVSLPVDPIGSLEEVETTLLNGFFEWGSRY